MFLLGSAATAALPYKVFAQGLPKVEVTKDPECGCCNGWVAHLRKSGFSVTTTNSADVPALKKRLGVPDDLVSCHTAEVAGYVIEGHVPAPAIRRLLQEKPTARGLAVPGMPGGSPGMPAEVHEVYEVTLFSANERRSFGKFRGDQQVST
jgi:hypothetical protein